MTAALRRLLTAVAPPPASFCVALSGGMDSAAMLAAAAPLRGEWGFSACHVNHGVSPRADSWEAFCRELCAAAGAPLVVRREKPPAAASEEWARDARLRAFAGLSADVAVLAHHADDQAETVLFRLLRGCGARGMAAMRPKAVVGGKTLLRPWLDVGREVVADFAKERGLRWIEDEDNRNLSRRRNFLRWRAMPMLAAEFPNCAATFSAAARRMREGAALLAALAEGDEAAARTADGGLCAARFRELGAARTRNWLYHALRARGADCGERHLGEAARQLTSVGRARELRFSFGGATLRKWRDGLYFEDGAAPAAPKDFLMELAAAPAAVAAPELGGDLILRERLGGGISPARLGGGGLLARLRVGGERLAAPGRPARAVADLLREADIAPWRRRRLPLLFAGDRLAAVPGVAVAAEFAARRGETGLECRFEWRV